MHHRSCSGTGGGFRTTEERITKLECAVETQVSTEVISLLLNCKNGLDFFFYMWVYAMLHLFLKKQDQACQAFNKNFSIKEMKTDHLPGEGKVAASKNKGNWEISKIKNFRNFSFLQVPAGGETGRGVRSWWQTLPLQPSSLKRTLTLICQTHSSLKRSWRGRCKTECV